MKFAVLRTYVLFKKIVHVGISFFFLVRFLLNNKVLNIILENESCLRVRKVEAIRIKEQKLSWDKLRTFNVIFALRAATV